MREDEIMKLLPHQQRILDWNPPKAILNHEMRTGKSLIGAKWIDHPAQAGNTFIICLKKNKKAWQEMGTKAQILTKEEFKKISGTIEHPTAIVWDEAHYGASGLFVKGRSQLATAFYTLVKKYPDCHVLLLSGTPVRQDAWSLHTLLCYVGIYYPWKDWRDEFFELKKMPYLRFPAWFPKDDWRMNIRKYIEKHTDIVSLKDVVDYLPEAQTRIIKIKQKKYVRPKDIETTWVDEHRFEQQGKLQEILDLGYKKVILVCKYTDQIDTLAKELAKEKPVFILDGRTKDQEAIIKQAQEVEECYFIVQSSCGESWDGWQFGALVFVSMSHSCKDHIQMFARQRHTGHLKVTETIYLLGGVWDTRILETIKKGKDFNPHDPSYSPSSK